MEWNPPLTKAIIQKRYKRFLSDVKLNDQLVTAHVPNTGSMTSCWEPQWTCALSKSDNPKRKLLYTLEYTHNGKTWIGVNTNNANKLVLEWLFHEQIPELKGYELIQTEKKIGESRIDFYLEKHPTLPDAYIEVKSVTLKKDNVAQFPDAPSIRGQKHLLELMSLKKKGYRAVMLFVIQREDVDQMRPAHTIDPIYSRYLKEAFELGVEILAYQCKINLREITLGKTIPILLE